MKNSPEDAKPENWHRFFAVESNKRAWELALVHTIHAHAASAASEHAEHERSCAAWR